jgi:hypothetical protein
LGGHGPRRALGAFFVGGESERYESRIFGMIESLFSHSVNSALNEDYYEDVANWLYPQV